MKTLLIQYHDENKNVCEKSFAADLSGSLARMKFIKDNFHTKDRKNCNNSCRGCGKYKLINSYYIG